MARVDSPPIRHSLSRTLAGTGDEALDRQRRRLEVLAALMPDDGELAFALSSGRAEVTVGEGAPRVSLQIRDWTRLRHHLLRRPLLLAMAFAYADGAVDIAGDVLEAARLKTTFTGKHLPLPRRLRALGAMLSW